MGIFKSFMNYAPILGKEENTNICVPKKASYGGRTLIFFLLFYMILLQFPQYYC